MPTTARRLAVLFVALFAMTALIASPSSLAHCVDRDGDGFGNPGNPYCPAGALIDCNDQSPTTYPGAPEVCDGYDSDCDGSIDNASVCNRVCEAPGSSGGDVQVTNDAAGSAPNGLGREGHILRQRLYRLLP